MAMRLKRSRERDGQIFLYLAKYGNTQSFLNIRTKILECACVFFFFINYSTMIYSLYIINKAGGLVYQKDFSNQLEKLSSNEYLVLAGTFHG
jgi:hypothetical protein